MLSFLKILLTIIYIQTFGYLVRSLYLLKIEKSPKGGRRLRLTVVILPTISIASILLIITKMFGLIYISIFGIWISLIIDFIYIIGLIPYYNILRKLKKKPGSVSKQIYCGSLSNSPFLYAIANTGDHLFIEISDFKFFLKNDPRKIDGAFFDELGFDERELLEIPHFSILPGSEQYYIDSYNFNKDEIHSISNEYEPIVSYCRINRELHFKINAALWETSCCICKNTPQVVAFSWKLFHFQETLRARFVILFNVADLLLRIVASIVFAELRRRGELSSIFSEESSFLKSGSYLNWIRNLEIALLKTSCNRLKLFRDALLQQRKDFKLIDDLLVPYKSILGNIEFEISEKNTINYLKILGFLRNQLLGHGSIGHVLTFRSMELLTPLYKLFLLLHKELVDQDLGVVAYQGNILTEDYKKENYVGTDRSFIWNKTIKDKEQNYYAYGQIPEGVVLFDPYLKFFKNRLIILNRIRKNEAEYLDYNVSNIIEPVFLKFKNSPSDFKETIHG